MEQLTPIFTKLAEIFCTSVEFVQANAMEYILMYGKYNAVKGLPFEWLGTTAVVFIIGIVVLAITDILDDYMYDDNGNTLKKILIMLGAISLMVGAIAGFYELWLYTICPEIYSIEAVLKMVGKL